MIDDDRKPPRHIRAVADTASDRARAHDQWQAIPIRREDDTVRIVPQGPPPGVPRTPTARDLGAECRAALAALLEGACIEADITTTEAGGVVTVDLTAKLTARGVEVLTERAGLGEVTALPSALPEKAAAVLAALTDAWQTAGGIASACGIERWEAERELARLRKRGLAWRVGDQWRRG